MILTNKEIEILNNYVIENPYPNYNDILKNIETNSELWNAYDINSHNNCKKIYENPNNINLIIEISRDIYKNGIKILQNCNNIIKFYSPYIDSSYDFIRKYPNAIEKYFQKIANNWDYS